MLGEISETIRRVKATKREATEELYAEFISYVNELEKAGLMQNGGFSLKDTVAYKQIVDKNSFAKAELDVRDEANPNKQHIEFGYGIGNFFGSIGRAWKTRKEPETIQKIYINIEKYISDNINPIEAEVDPYVQKLKSDYQSDIQSLKSNTKKNIDAIFALIQKMDENITEMKKEAAEIAVVENTYVQTITEIENVRSLINSLISKINYTKI